MGSRSRSSRKHTNLKTYSVFVGHLPHTTQQAQLIELFEAYGTITDVFIQPKDPQKSLSYGFVRFKKLESALASIQALDGWILNSQRICVELSTVTAQVAEELIDEVKNQDLLNLNNIRKTFFKVKEQENFDDWNIEDLISKLAEEDLSKVSHYNECLNEINVDHIMSVLSS